LKLKPNEFWELLPKDIIIMHEGFEVEREYKEALHLQTLRCIRHVGHTVYMGIPTKKGFKKVSSTKYYPLPLDEAEKVTYTDEQRRAFFEQKEPVITNGKLRGYMDSKGNIEYIN
jgi:hypothetical protein